MARRRGRASSSPRSLPAAIGSGALLVATDDEGKAQGRDREGGQGRRQGRPPTTDTTTSRLRRGRRRRGRRLGRARQRRRLQGRRRHRRGGRADRGGRRLHEGARRRSRRAARLRLLQHGGVRRRSCRKTGAGSRLGPFARPVQGPGARDVQRQRAGSSPGGDAAGVAQLRLPDPRRQRRARGGAARRLVARARAARPRQDDLLLRRRVRWTGRRPRRAGGAAQGRHRAGPRQGRDLAGWGTGACSCAARRVAELGGALVVETTDEAASRRFIDAVGLRHELEAASADR